MSDDKMQNNDFNPNDISGSGLPQDSGSGNLNPSAGLPDNEIPPEINLSQEELNAKAVNYEFSQMQGTPANDGTEVHIDPSEHEKEPVTVRPVEFTPFDSYTPTNTDTNKNLELLMDIKLELTVELGRCQLPVKKVLELTRGSIIELDKVAGESVELFANGKHVANGEVVVIEDNFGLRITSITDPQERIKSL